MVLNPPPPILCHIFVPRYVLLCFRCSSSRCVRFRRFVPPPVCSSVGLLLRRFAPPKRLVLGHYFNHPIQRLSLPGTLRRLAFGGIFDQPLKGVKWPEKLESVELGQSFSRAGVQWPRSGKRYAVLCFDVLCFSVSLCVVGCFCVIPFWEIGLTDGCLGTIGRTSPPLRVQREGELWKSVRLGAPCVRNDRVGYRLKENSPPPPARVCFRSSRGNEFRRRI